MCYKKMKFIKTCLLFIGVLTGFISHAQEVPVIKIKQLNALMQPDKQDTLYVINFWATWCKPCVEELPEFMKAKDEFGDKPVKFIFISLDFMRNYDDRLLPFVKEKNMDHVYLLNEPDYNSWIGLVDKNWEGSLPATLFVKGKSKSFFEKQLTFDEISDNIKKNLNNIK